MDVVDSCFINLNELINIYYYTFTANEIYDC